MYHFAEEYAGDLGHLASLPFPSFYERVKDIPYQSDDEIFPEERDRILEVVARPALLLNRNVFRRLDCKKKSILCGAWAARNRRPFAFLAVSEMPSREIHHVFPVIDYDGRGYRTADATFPEFRIGQAFPITRAEELLR